MKSKFKVGQRVWSIKNGYVEWDTIKAIFLDKWDSINISFTNSFAIVVSDTNRQQFNEDSLYNEFQVFATKKELLDSITKEIKTTETEYEN